jgi:uncharacterized protein YbjT (DUF2867 family)
VTNPQKLILVTGATGYIASRLIPQLLDRGYAVRALARNPQRLQSRSWSGKINIVHGDIMEPASLASAFREVNIAYYLIHNMSLGRGYTKLEIQAAHNFVLAAEEAGVQHIIYLGGLADEEQHIAPHMRSRIETGSTLRQGKVPVTEFRAGVIAGSGSISFEMIRFMTELFPIIPAPVWIKNKSQPISTQNVIDYLLSALDNHNGQDRIFEIGGPHVTTYQELMLRYAQVRGHRRKFLLLPYVPVWFMAFGIGLTTPVPRPIARALVGGLSNDSVVMHNDALEIYPEVNLIDYESATREALTHLHPLKIERVWDDGASQIKTLKHEGFFIVHQKIKVNAKPEKIFDVVTKISKSFETQRFVVDTTEPNHLLLLRSQRKTPGDGWIEWRTGQVVNWSYLTQTVFFAPYGTAGFLYWYLLYPFRTGILNGLIKNIARNSVVK